MSEIVHKFPASLESLGFRKGTQDWGVTFSVPREVYRYAKPLGDKLNEYFIIAAVPVETREQAECLLAEQIEIPIIDQAEKTVKIVTTAELEEMFSMTRQHVALLARTNILVKISQGKFDLIKSVKGYVDDLRRQSQGKGNADYQAERARRLAIQREEAEINLLERKKALVNAELMAKGITEWILLVKNKLLSASSRADNVESQEVIDNIVRELCTDLSRIDIGEIVNQASKQPVQATRKADSKPVGRKGKSPKPKGKRRGGKLAK